MAKATQPVSVNGLEFDALIDESRVLEASVPEYSVEKGYCISDSIILSPEKLNMTLFVTNTPVTWHDRHGNNPNRVQQVVKKLEEIYFAKEPVKIVTSEAVYTDMAIESLTISKTLEVGYSRQIPISFKKIGVTRVATTKIPDSYGKSGASNASAGSANTSSEKSSGSNGSSGSKGSPGKSESNKDSKSSILYEAANSIGLI
ncbi:MAG: hypothetical protein IKJ99_03445 [Oscillospiraceae bacterium]|nr:hypothetical protein [Oscillospiraceae bacterium]